MSIKTFPILPFNGQEFIDALRIKYVYSAFEKAWIKIGVVDDIPLASESQTGLFDAHLKCLLDSIPERGGGFGIITPPLLKLREGEKECFCGVATNVTDNIEETIRTQGVALIIWRGGIGDPRFTDPDTFVIDSGVQNVRLNPFLPGDFDGLIFRVSQSVVRGQSFDVVTANELRGWTDQRDFRIITNDVEFIIVESTPLNGPEDNLPQPATGVPFKIVEQTLVPAETLEHQTIILVEGANFEKESFRGKILRFKTGPQAGNDFTIITNTDNRIFICAMIEFNDGDKFCVVEPANEDGVLRGNIVLCSDSLAIRCVNANGSELPDNCPPVYCVQPISGGLLAPGFDFTVKDEFLNSFCVEVPGCEGPWGPQGDKGDSGRPGTGDGPQGDKGLAGQDATVTATFTDIEIKDIDDIFDTAIVDMQLNANSGKLLVVKSKIRTPSDDKPLEQVIASPIFRSIEFTDNEFGHNIVSPLNDPLDGEDPTLAVFPRAFQENEETELGLIQLSTVIDSLVLKLQERLDQIERSMDLQVKEHIERLDGEARQKLGELATKLADCEWQLPIEFCLGTRPNDCDEGQAVALGTGGLVGADVPCIPSQESNLFDDGLRFDEIAVSPQPIDFDESPYWTPCSGLLCKEDLGTVRVPAQRHPSPLSVNDKTFVQRYRWDDPDLTNRLPATTVEILVGGQPAPINRVAIRYPDQDGLDTLPVGIYIIQYVAGSFFDSGAPHLGYRVGAFNNTVTGISISSDLFPRDVPRFQNHITAASPIVSASGRVDSRVIFNRFVTYTDGSENCPHIVTQDIGGVIQTYDACRGGVAPWYLQVPTVNISDQAEVEDAWKNADLSRKFIAIKTFLPGAKIWITVPGDQGFIDFQITRIPPCPDGPAEISQDIIDRQFRLPGVQLPARPLYPPQNLLP